MLFIKQLLTVLVLSRTGLGLPASRNGISAREELASSDAKPRGLVDDLASDLLSPSPAYFQTYNFYAEHTLFLESLALAYPGHAVTVNAGYSYQGRPILGIHIWGKTRGNPAVVIHGNAHAREWISSAVAEYIAYGVLKNAYPGITDNYDLYIFPIVNPDGYVYTATSNRQWIKNRQNTGNLCYGVNLDNNWNQEWGTVGVSTNPCSDSYSGASAASSSEVYGLSSFFDSLLGGTGIKMFINYGAYGQLVLSPWSYTTTPSPDSAEQLRVGNIIATAMTNQYGKTYTSGSVAQTTAPTSGTAVDYVYGVLEVVHSYWIMLRDTGDSAYLLPANQITPSGKEALAGLAAAIAAL
ncbi:hypothetical protein TWF694_001832 [Orbilia ellipsospora]|uniref:Peptidase M14 domain-containing protein n=1 Tax=Orbilia ellipsospora TaxID=2528407 RepID=A0AAV9X6A6_9PEZI